MKNNRWLCFPTFDVLKVRQKKSCCLIWCEGKPLFFYEKAVYHNIFFKNMYRAFHSAYILGNGNSFLFALVGMAFMPWARNLISLRTGWGTCSRSKYVVPVVKSYFGLVRCECVLTNRDDIHHLNLCFYFSIRPSSFSPWALLDLSVSDTAHTCWGAIYYCKNENQVKINSG